MHSMTLWYTRARESKGALQPRRQRSMARRPPQQRRAATAQGRLQYLKPPFPRALCIPTHTHGYRWLPFTFKVAPDGPALYVRALRTACSRRTAVYRILYGTAVAPRRPTVRSVRWRAISPLAGASGGLSPLAGVASGHSRCRQHAANPTAQVQIRHGTAALCLHMGAHDAICPHLQC